MELTIVANFDTRRDAETAVEHLVQEPASNAPTSSSARPARRTRPDPAGRGRLESGHPGVEKHGTPELSGPIEVSVDCDAGRSTVVRSALEKAGARELRGRMRQDGRPAVSRGAYLNVGRSFRASLVAPGITILRSMVFSCW